MKKGIFMIYEYRCLKCDHEFDVYKRVTDIDNPEKCEKCGAPTDRLFRPKIYLNNTAVEHAEYNPALGCVVKNKEHRKEVAKRKGCVEVGNDFSSGAKMQKYYNKQREEKLNKVYDESLKEAVAEHRDGVYGRSK